MIDININKFLVINKYNMKSNIVISIPHSGTYIPDNIRKQMRKDVVFSNQDWFLIKLYSFFKSMGVTAIVNNISRYVIDVNRNIAENGSNYSNTLVYDKNTWGNSLYDFKLGLDEINRRINEFYLPYHNELRGLLDEKLYYFPNVILFDLHSFAKFKNDNGADVIISNNNGMSANDTILNRLKYIFEKYDFSVAINDPVRGGYITRYYGSYNNINAIQIEIRYNRYIENREFFEEEIEKYNMEIFENAQYLLGKVFSEFLF